MSACKESYNNKYEDYSSNSSIISDGQLSASIKGKLDEALEKLLSNLEKELPALEASTDTSVYTGSSGIVLLYHLLWSKTKNKQYLTWSQRHLSGLMRNLRGRRECFLNGDAGPLALATVMFWSANPELLRSEYLKRLVALHTKVIARSPDMPDEMLYGRAGYLYALLFVNKWIGEDTVNADVIRKVIVSILDSGQTLARHYHCQDTVPLVFEWHGKNYLGAAHGTAGILYQLLGVKELLTANELDKLILPTVNALLQTKFPSGNFPSSNNNDRDRLVQWCHGAPGLVQLLSKAYQVYGNEKFLKAALECGEVVWRRGVLSKGYSICHGVAGNGYTFLQLYQLTGDVRHLHRAACFGEWCTSWPKKQHLSPDRPFSLFEGLAGIIYFLVDLKDPERAAFPGYAT